MSEPPPARGSPSRLAAAPTGIRSAPTKSSSSRRLLGHGGGGHTSWHCRTFDAVVYGPPLNIHCCCLEGPASVRISPAAKLGIAAHDCPAFHLQQLFGEYLISIDATRGRSPDDRANTASGQGSGGCLTDSRQKEPPPRLGGGSVMSLSPALAGGVSPPPALLSPPPLGALGVACLIKTYSSDFGSSDLSSYSGLGRNLPTIACCASSIAFFWAVHCRSTRSVNAFRWCSICSLIALR